VKRAVDGATTALLLLAVALAVALAARGGGGRAYLPLQGPGDPPGALRGPGRAEAALQAKVAALGDYLTVEDLARGALALERGELPEVTPLSAGERERLAALLAEADAHRTELLALEGEIAQVESELGAVARSLAASLTPAQRDWIQSQRDQVSVGEVERAYWDAALQAVGAP
jgi:hypothetical protein